MNLLPSLFQRRAPAVWDPFRDMRDLQTELNRFFEPWGNGSESGAVAWAPRMDVLENDRTLTLKFDVPGIDRKDIRVESANGILTISGESKMEKEEKKEEYVRVERSYGSFSRSFALPDYVDAKSISAECKDGVLRVTMAKVAGAKPEPAKIEVK